MPETGALDAAMRYLGPKARSCQEVRTFLVRKGFDEEAVASAEARLVELGLLDDAAMAQAWAEEARLRRREAPARVRAMLAARGVPEAAISAALDAGGGRDQREDPDLDVALAAAEVRMRSLSGDEPTMRRKLWGYLARRGFDAEVIGTVCSRLLGREDWD